MAATYSSQNRTGVILTNTSNEAIELTDGTTAYRFAPGEGKALSGELAVRLNGRDGRLSLPDDANGALFRKGIPLGQVIAKV